MKRAASSELVDPAIVALESSPGLPHRIPCDKMPQQEEVLNAEEDWTGVTDPKLRRRLQNRLNQRAKRRRETGQVQKKAFPDGKWDDLTELPTHLPSHELGPISPQPQHGTIIDKLQDVPALPLSVWLRQAGGAQRTEAVALARLFKNYTRARRSLSSPSSDLLLSLTQYNLFRALILNNFTLGLTMEWLDEDAISPFCGSYATRPDALYPDSLRPTALQKMVEHHPWIDLFPHAQMRDNMIMRLETYDEDRLCEDMVGWSRGPMSSCGVRVWKDPWDASGWEVSEAFAKAWPWVIAGCVELQKSTNQWRRQRGEPAMRFTEIT